MCLTLNFNSKYAAEKAKRNPKIAKEDMVVYKSLRRKKDNQRNKYTSPYYPSIYWQMDMHYYRTEDKVSRNASDYIKQCAKILGTIAFKSRWGWTLSIHQGFHSCLTKEQAIYKNGNVVARMIIPKGSKYYSDGKDVVSSDIIFPRQKIQLKDGNSIGY